VVDRRYDGKVAVVLGIGPVGEAIATRFAKEGASVAVVDFNEARGREVADAINANGDRAVPLLADVTNEEQVAAAMATVDERFGRLDVLYNNTVASSAGDLDIVDMSWELFQRTMLTNVGGVMLACKHGVPIMKRTGGGSIINTASVSALWGQDARSAYGSSKAAIMTLTKYIATMYGKDGIRCNAIAPSLVMNESLETTLDESGFLAGLRAERLLDWPTSPSELAGIACWLASDEARGITGQTIVVDSGTTAHRHRHAFKQWDAIKPAGPIRYE
jgi:NAD(P)-dependent dehydrogenase (short-subunit alcohol dehydrogenase family)